jgi:hypothetical protein
MRASTRVKVTVDRASDISESVVDAMLVETTAIWHTLGLDLERATPEGDVAATTVRVIITDEGVSAPNEPLGWIRFLTPRDPEPIIHLSRAAALRLLASTSRLQRLPQQRRELLLGRMLGRALAHQIGHYLLRSNMHTPSGLMRPTWPLELLIANDRVGFKLE